MLEVLQPGIYTTVQDMGRKGVGRFGIPTSGAMDSYSAKLANLLLQNEENDAVLEITFGGCRLRFQAPTVLVITGADFSAKINDSTIAMNTVIPVVAGDILSFGKRLFGCRTYLAIKGGFQTPEVLGSRSFYKGITFDFLIRKEQALPYIPYTPSHTGTNASVKVNLRYFTNNELLCTKGPEWDLLSDQQKQQVLTSTFTLSKDSNRMGIRLNEFVDNKLPSMLTSAVLPGTVQLTPSGTLIILMRDGQVTGGYPRVLQLMDEGISCLAQKVVGERVRFEQRGT
jgi:biotin-dependent carboxylase-like uncharacterized protein